MSTNQNMSNKEVADLIFLNYKDQTPFLNLDYANVTTTGLEATREFATGGQGAPQRITFDHSRKGTLKIETQIASAKLFQLLSGSDMKDSFNYVKREVITAAEDGQLVIPEQFNIDLTNPESISVCPLDADGSTVLFPTAVNDGTISVAAVTAGNDYAVYGTVKASENVQAVKFDSKSFPKAFTIHGETPWKTETDEAVAMHLTYYKAVPQSNFELAFSNSGIISLSITCDLLADKDGNICDMAIIG